MFSEDKFVKLSRKFVCVRLESYESVETQDLVRKLLDGRFENTAFCVMAPGGDPLLTRAGRSPQAVLGNQRSQTNVNDGVYMELEKIARNHKGSTDQAKAVAQDFHSFKQALNVASCDQRLLLFNVVADDDRKAVEEKMKIIAGHAKTIGRFHFDYVGKGDENWSDRVTGENLKAGTYIIEADEFGQKGKVLAEFPPSESISNIAAKLLALNQTYATAQKKKVYSEHIQKGRSEGVRYIDNLPWGEDKDGDGKIDPQRSR